MTEAELSWWIPALFLLAAVLYSSVGHGGASAYLAILIFFGFERANIAPMVLGLNILVTATGFRNYFRAGHFRPKILFPFIFTSIPGAFLGGMLSLPPKAFSGVLGFTLFFAGLRFLFFNKPVSLQAHLGKIQIYAVGMPVGFLLGLLAGMVGVGGGIFLSPLLMLMGWSDAKKTAAVSAGFIILNSTSGLLAHFLTKTPDWAMFAPLALSVLIGGQLGSWFGAWRIPPVTIQKLLGGVLLVASLKLIRELF